MSKPKSTTIQRVAERPGEGAILATHRQQSVNVDGTTGIALAIDMSSAPVPERRYVADVASVVRVADSVRLIFGQSRVGNNELRSLVVIHMPSLGIHQFLSSADEIKAAMVGFAKKFRLSVGQLTQIQVEPLQTVALAATIIMASVSGREACMDFYYSSPYIAYQVIRGGKFAVDPVARVMLPMNLLLAICNQLEAIKDDLPNDSTEGST